MESSLLQSISLTTLQLACCKWLQWKKSKLVPCFVKSLIVYVVYV